MVSFLFLPSLKITYINPFGTQVYGAAHLMTNRVIRKTGCFLPEYKNFGSLDTDVSLERTLSQNMKPSQSQNVLFLIINYRCLALVVATKGGVFFCVSSCPPRESQ